MNNTIKEEITKYYLEKEKKEFIPGESHVPVSGKYFDHEELIKMTEAVLEGWWTEGKFCNEFEKKLSEFIGVKYCAVVNSGSSANLLAISCLTSHRLPDEKRLKPGDEVITVAAGFPTTVNPIIQNNLIPVFVDVDLPSFNASIDEIEKAISTKTKAIFIAHTLGNPFDLDKILDICNKNNLWLIEDNCDALGSKYNNKHTGSFGHISTLSFYPAHHITTAEGGALLTNDPLLYKILMSMRDWGRDCVCPTGKDNVCGKRFDWQLGDLPQGYDHKYTYSEIGYNLKMTDISAALGLVQLDRLQNFIKQRKNNYSYLKEKLKHLNDYFIFFEADDKSDPSWFGFLITLKTECKFSREEIIRFLDQKKIGSRLLFAGNIIKQPYFVNKQINYRTVSDLKNTDTVMNNSFWIGVCPLLTEKMLDCVVESFEEFIKLNG